ncbi:hypothetical protein B0H34DRAFT_133598 [Crassisporium funariophilum]|nr:hypothetical protein B0H34DRAFT_133598 [Crassisporium funariophilum]
MQEISMNSLQVELSPDIHPLPEFVNEYVCLPVCSRAPYHYPRIITAINHCCSPCASRSVPAVPGGRERAPETRCSPQNSPWIRTSRKSSTKNPGNPSPHQAGESGQDKTHQRTRSVMDDLVDQLAALEAAASPGDALVMAFWNPK